MHGWMIVRLPYTTTLFCNATPSLIEAESGSSEFF